MNWSRETEERERERDDTVADGEGVTDWCGAVPRARNARVVAVTPHAAARRVKNYSTAFEREE
jgi:hypothetical protein